jgi:hypothetical protein
MSTQSSSRHPRAAEELARSLGWFSVGLGVFQLVCGGTVSHWLGMRGAHGIVRGYGVREIATGVMILGTEDPAPGIKGRVAGDALDLATLGVGLERSRSKANTMLALAAVAGVTFLDVLCMRWLGERRSPKALHLYVRRTGFPQGSAAQAWGAARDFIAPPEYRTPELLRPLSR